MVTALLQLTLAEATPTRCAGGDGPKPLADISNLFHLKVKALDTPSTLQEFLIWEKRNLLVYRDVSGDVKGLPLHPHPHVAPHEMLMTKVSQPLSRLVDPAERYLVSTGDRIWVYDTWGYGWSNAVQKKNVEPLYWAKDRKKKVQVLVSHSVETGINGAEIHQFFVNTPGETAIAPRCSIQLKDNGWKAARGAMDPYFYFYSVTKVDDRWQVILQPFNVLSCRLEKGTIYGGIRYPVQEVLYFGALGAIAVKVDHPTESLLWWSPQGCGYFDVGGVSPLVPNFSLPILMSWKAGSSLQIIYPEKSEKVEVLKGLPLQKVSEKDLWISKDATKLFISTNIENEKDRWTMEMNLKP